MPRPALQDLPARTQLVLADMPPWYSESETARAIINAGASEFGRIEDFANELRKQAAFPQFADDTYGILGLWEARYGLIPPVGATIDARRALVLAHRRKKKSGSRFDWEQAVTQALNTNQWSYTLGPADYEISVKFPYSVGWNSAQALALIEEVSPAHEEITVGYDEGWLVGIALVGVDTL